MTPKERQTNAEAVIEKLFPEWRGNKTSMDILRETERGKLKATHPIVDLRNISKEEHHRYANCAVVLPPGMEEALKLMTFPLTPEQVNLIEDQANEYHGIEPPHAILILPDFAERGKCWFFEPALEPTQTGLVYIHDFK